MFNQVIELNVIIGGNPTKFVSDNRTLKKISELLYLHI